MAFWDKNLKQDVIYWGNPVPNGYGSYNYDTPVQLKGRWEDYQENFIDDDGEERRAKGRIFLNQAVDRKGYLALGNADSAPANPSDSYDAFMIHGIKFIPSLKNDKTLYYAIL